MNKHFKKIISLLKRVNVFALVFFVPLFFAVILPTNNVFDLNKTAILRILVLLLFVLMFPRYKIKNTKANLVVLVFFVSLLVSTLASIDPGLSFFGLYDRQEGLLSYLYYIMFFFLMFSYFEEKENGKKLVLWSLVLSSLVVCAYGLLQVLGLDPLGWTESTKMRATATFGQPNNLGSYLLFAIPLTTYLFFKYKNYLLKTFLALLVFFQIVILYYSFSTSAWLGLIVGFLVVIPGALWATRNPVKIERHNSKGPSLFNVNKKLIFFISVSALAIILFAITQFTPGIAKDKVSNLLDLRTGSTAARLQFWEASVEAIKEKPILGYGLESQEEIIRRHYKSDWAVFSNVNVQPSRAHNFFLDALLTGGILGLLGHLLLWGFVFYSLIANIKKNRDKSFNLALLTAFLSYFVYLQFNFPHVTTQVYFWLFLALSVSSSSELWRSTVTGSRGLGMTLLKNAKRSLLILFFAVVVFGTYSLIVYESKKVSADHFYMEMRRGDLENRYVYMIKMYDEVKKNEERYSFYDRNFIKLLMPWTKRFKNEYFNESLRERVEKILEKTSTDTFSDLEVRAQSYEFLAYFDEENFKRAEESLKKLIDLSPNMPYTHRLYANFLYRQDRLDEARVQYDLCLENLPGLESQGLNLEHKAAIEREMGYCEVLK